MEYSCKKVIYNSPIAYAVKHKDEKIVSDSRSGGVFTALSDYILNCGGVIYGCVLDKKFQAIHIRATSTLERNNMRGSKYIQSELRETYRNIKIDLEQGLTVLFSGTSCQVAGLYSFLQKNYDKLYTIDIVCHGVPSPKVWKDYLKWITNKSRKKIINVNFRNKKEYGWREHVETITFLDGKNFNSRIFKTIFYGHNILRPSCFSCPYKSILHPGNITIADFWGIENCYKKFDDNKGVSLVLINDDVGKSLFERIMQHINFVEVPVEKCKQNSFVAPYEKPNTREKFWIDYGSHSFSYIAKKYGDYGIRNRIIKMYRRINNKMKRIFVKLLIKH